MKNYLAVEENDPTTIIAFTTQHNRRIWVEKHWNRSKLTHVDAGGMLRELSYGGHLPVGANVYLTSADETVKNERKAYAESIMPDCRVDGAAKKPIEIRT
ncbi:MAG: hypothetical protein GY832_31060 [Chloroflexi bacterium]|nr:hypothetical protein [Chloroflexota bacterium]